MLDMRFTRKMDLVGGGKCISISWNSDKAFDAEIIIVMLVHNSSGLVKRAVDSVLGQITSHTFSLLIVDDSSIDDWDKKLDKQLMDERVVVASAICGETWKARNLAHRLIWKEFPGHQWICRLDADDRMASYHVLENTIQKINKKKPNAMWVLSSNLLEEKGQQLARDNLAVETLLDQDYLLKRLKWMKHDKPRGELPSCNLWIRRGFICHYPEMESAEDHWLVTFLLVRYKDDGCLLSDIYHNIYNLSGLLTMSNRRKGQYLWSRDLLYRSAKYWMGLDTEMEDSLCLGWGGEGTVWLEEGTIKKRFIDTNLTDEQADWLGENITGPYLPQAEWRKIDGCWQAEYPYIETKEAACVPLEAVSRFITYCLDHRVVCLNITRRNFRMLDSNLLFIDLGKDILPFKTRYFRDMCARLYLVFVNGISDIELALMTKDFRNNVDKMRSINGFEQYYNREMHRWFLEHRYLAKPPRNIEKPKRNHPDVTLILKCCPMDSNIIERAVHHIVGQLGAYDSYYEIVILVDPFEGPYLRQYAEGDLPELLKKVQNLKISGIIDRVIVAPNKDQMIVSELNKHWFGIDTKATHTVEDAPLFPHLWGFEQMNTRYVLQMDIDVIISGFTQDHDVMREMLDAIKKEKVFCVGFNIPQPNGAPPKEYNAPKGSFVPEVRMGLLDLKRMLEQRPFPNSVVDNKPSTSWYRSIENYQKRTGWRSLRGGNPMTYYIHPPNDSKHDTAFIDTVTDQVEQALIPENQRSQWDLVGDYIHWHYQERKKPIIIVIFGRNPGYHWGRGCLKSLFFQIGVDWEAIIIDDRSSPEYQRWLYNYIKPYRNRITLVRTKNIGMTPQKFEQIIQEICTGHDQKIVFMRQDECLIHKHALAHIVKGFDRTHQTVWGHTYMSRHPLGLLLKDDGKLDDYQLPYNLRGAELGCVNWHQIFSILKGTSATKKLDYDIKSGHFIQEYLFYNPHIHYKQIKNKTLRQTTYIPNMRRIEIDITYDCNLRCPGCSRSCSQAPSKLHMPIEMIHAFIEETENRNIQWESVHILGGEPTLHPQFNEIIGILNDWFEKNSPSTDLKVITNGAGDVVKRRLSEIPERWLYNRSFKSGIITEYFEPFNISPIDLPKWKYEDFTKGCYITQDSGIGLTPFGYFHCAIAGGIERIMGFKQGYNEIPTHPWAFLKQMKVYCKFCGHFLNDTYQSRDEQVRKNISPNAMSETWKRAYQDLASKK